MAMQIKLFQPMLASPAPDAGELVYPLLGSPKYDGVRTVIRGHTALSRSLNAIPNQKLQEVLGQPAFEGLDGELIAGEPTSKDVFQRSQSAMKASAPIEDLTYYVFDWCGGDLKMPFKERYAEARRLVGGSHVMVGGLDICLVEQVLLKTAADLTAYEDTCVKAGYEGIMVRSQTGRYKLGRSTVKEGFLLKVKQFEHDEAEIFGAYELMHNGNEKTIDARGYAKRSSHQENKVPSGLLGGFHVKMLTGDFKGVAVDVGTGWTDDERARLWRIFMKLGGAPIFQKKYGAMRVKWQKAGSKDRPRFPVFDGWRSLDDMS